MFSVVRLIDVAEESARDPLLNDLRGAADCCDAAVTRVEPTLPGVRNGGDILMHLRFDDPAEWDSVADDFGRILTDPRVRRVNGATYTGTPVVASEGTATVYRTLLLRVQPGTADGAVTRFEDDLRRLTRYVAPIRTWQLSRVVSAVGTSPWTHVFEQEFSDLDGLTGPYLMHPIHWAFVDRWFDPECPECIVRERVCHSFCTI
jgi:hypothetical protein